jgi:hypothetical protein
VTKSEAIYVSPTLWSEQECGKLFGGCSTALQTGAMPNRLPCTSSP